MNKKILSFTLAAAMSASFMQTAVFATPPTGAEALITVIQTIGKESEALSETTENPFTDVPEWEDRYAAYAYKNGIVSGVGNNKFEADRTVISLPDVGITGNSHFMFREKNSEEIARHVENWIKENVQ